MSTRLQRLRTELGTCLYHERSGKWDCSFQSYVGELGREQLMAVARSAPLWDTEDEAWKAGNRALTYLEEQGYFPNMCERW